MVALVLLVCCAVVARVGGAVVGLLVGVGEHLLPLVEGPRGELAVLEGIFDVFKFLVHAVLGRGNCLGPVC